MKILCFGGTANRADSLSPSVLLPNRLPLTTQRIRAALLTISLCGSVNGISPPTASGSFRLRRYRVQRLTTRHGSSQAVLSVRQASSSDRECQVAAISHRYVLDRLSRWIYGSLLAPSTHC